MVLTPVLSFIDNSALIQKLFLWFVIQGKKLSDIEDFIDIYIHLELMN